MDAVAPHILLNPDEIRKVEEAVFAAGTPAETLMEEAGQAVATVTADAIGGPHSCERPILILCGPGNNGGDGFVTARLLQDMGYPVTVMTTDTAAPKTATAQAMALKWTGVTSPPDLNQIKDATVIVDALFGAGLSKPVDGVAADMIQAANAADALRIAVDLPSGLLGRSGQTLGIAFAADFTVTFIAKKPGHVIAPGRFVSGGIDKTVLADIGIDASAYAAVTPLCFHNVPSLWGGAYPHAGPQSHKYDRGHVLVLGGREPTLGASRLASMAALRVGAGLVTLAAPSETYVVQAAALTDIMVRRFDQDFGFKGMLSDPRIGVALMGPGAGIGERTARLVQSVLETSTTSVLDADALNSLAGRLDLLERAEGTTILTPHQGEFDRLFPDLDAETDRIAAARGAATQTGAHIVLKGVSTLVAAPDGRVSICSNAPASLSVAGTGDVLAGLIAGLVGQGMPAFEAASAGVWMHGAAATRVGKGLIASDLLGAIKGVLP